MGNTILAIQALTQLLTQAQGYTNLLARTRAEGREPSDAELDTLAASDDAARTSLQAKIDAARAQGR